MYKIKEIEEGKVLNFRSLKMQDVVQLCKDINKLYEEGYKIKEKPTLKQCPKIPILFNLMFEKGVEKTKEEVEIPSKKKDLLKFAKEKEIDIPKDTTHPLSIKKFIKENL